MDRLPINHKVTIKVKITTTKKYLLNFQIAYICYSHLCIHQEIRNTVFDIHRVWFFFQNVYGFKLSKNPMSIMLSVIMIYEKVKLLKYIVLDPHNFALNFIYVVLD